jgi:hypothetical protein
MRPNELESLRADVQWLLGEKTKAKWRADAAEAKVRMLEQRLAAADAVVEAAREFTYDTSDSWAGKNGQQWFTVTLPVDDVSRLCAYISQYDAAKGGES